MTWRQRRLRRAKQSGFAPPPPPRRAAPRLHACVHSRHVRSVCTVCAKDSREQRTRHGRDGRWRFARPARRLRREGGGAHGEHVRARAGRRTQRGEGVAGVRGAREGASVVEGQNVRHGRHVQQRRGARRHVAAEGAGRRQHVREIAAAESGVQCCVRFVQMSTRWGFRTRRAPRTCLRCSATSSAAVGSARPCASDALSASSTARTPGARDAASAAAFASAACPATSTVAPLPLPPPAARRSCVAAASAASVAGRSVPPAACSASTSTSSAAVVSALTLRRVQLREGARAHGRAAAARRARSIGASTKKSSSCVTQAGEERKGEACVYVAFCDFRSRSAPGCGGARACP
jgi:hypothetical protein